MAEFEPDFHTSYYQTQSMLRLAGFGEAADFLRAERLRLDPEFARQEAADEEYQQYVQRVNALEAQGETVATVTVGERMACCSACGGQTDPSEERHISGGPRSDGSPGSDLSQANGCGAVFVERIDEPGGFSF